MEAGSKGPLCNGEVKFSKKDAPEVKPVVTATSNMVV